MVTYEKYQELGYNLIPQNAFEKYKMMTESFLQKITFGRITQEELEHKQQNGFCEICDEFYKGYESTVGGKISSFTNDGYTEKYAVSPDKITVWEKCAILAGIYFHPKLFFRGVEKKMGERPC